MKKDTSLPVGGRVSFFVCVIQISRWLIIRQVPVLKLWITGQDKMSVFRHIWFLPGAWWLRVQPCKRNGRSRSDQTSGRNKMWCKTNILPWPVIQSFKTGSWRIIFCEFHNYRKKGYLSSPYRGRLVAFYGDTFFFMYSYCKISIFIQCFVYLLQLLLF